LIRYQNNFLLLFIKVARHLRLLISASTLRIRSGTIAIYLPTTSRASLACVHLEIAPCTSVPCPFVRSSVHPCLLSCLSLSVPGSGTTGGIGWSCRGGRSSKRPTQFQPGSQLLLVLRRSAENERREKRAACVRGVAAVVCASANPPPCGPDPPPPCPLSTGSIYPCS